MKYLTMILCVLLLNTAAYAKPDKVVAGGLITPPKVKYPRSLEAMDVEGFVRVRVVVDTKGRILSTTILQSSGYPGLDKAALYAVRTATYRPTTVNGKPVRTAFSVPINFVLEGKKKDIKSQKPFLFMLLDELFPSEQSTGEATP